MNEKPILFSGEMVRAILEGRKTQTRRVLRVVDGNDKFLAFGIYGKALFTDNILNAVSGKPHDFLISCPYGLPGDRLWVRETWRITGWDEDGDWCIEYKDGSSRWFDSVQGVDEDTSVRYWMQCTDDCMKAGIPEDDAGYFTFGPETPCPTRWRPSIHMPRWASRITLEIVNVRVERLQEISPNDVVAEGVDGGFGELAQQAEYKLFFRASLRDKFSKLWDSINAPRGYGWDVNPWVWVIEFKKD